MFRTAVAGEKDGGHDVRRLHTYVTQFERPRNTYSSGTLTVAATLLPDLLAYVVSKNYIELRNKGLTHDAAIEDVVKVLKKKSKDLIGRAGLHVVLSGKGIHTFHADLPQKTMRLLSRKKSSGDSRKKGFKPVKIKLATKPSHMRVAEVRVKKFFKLKGGLKREPILSKLKTVRLLESRKGEVDLTFPKKIFRSNRGFRLELRGSAIKHYNGPFEDDLIDLNRRRYTWKPIESIEIILDLPPEGTDVPATVQDLVKLVMQKV